MRFYGSATSTKVMYCLLVCLASCTRFPERNSVPHSQALPPSDWGPLAELRHSVDGDVEDGESAYWLVEQSAEALNVRLALFDSAVSSLDIQYFIWEPDTTGRLLKRRLLEAAARGVQVRLLMDDITTSGRDAEFIALDLHANIEVRLFNPWRLRSKIGRVPEFFARFGALNHRLHNKTIIADGQVALIGGRNLGDRYFGLYDVFVQNDLDILMAGQVTSRVVEDFDLYWNSSVTYPIDQHLAKKIDGIQLDSFEAYLDDYIAERSDHLAQFPLQPADWDGLWGELGDTYALGSAEYLYDLPDVGTERPEQLYRQIKAFIDGANSEVIISSAYFVPDREFVEQLAALSRRGVRIVVLTNSLQTNNHTVAHVAYKRWRKELLEAGVELYELRPDAALLNGYAVPPAMPGFLGLHSKAVIVDRRFAFVGTPNFDPRAMLLNTENGVAVDSPELAEELRALLVEAMSSANAWRVEMNGDGKIVWTGDDAVHERQPANGFGHRILEFFINLLPLKSQA